MPSCRTAPLATSCYAMARKALDLPVPTPTVAILACSSFASSCFPRRSNPLLELTLEHHAKSTPLPHHARAPRSSTTLEPHALAQRSRTTPEPYA